MKGIIKGIYQTGKDYSCLWIMGGKSIFQPIKNNRIDELGVKVGRKIEDILADCKFPSLSIKDTERLKNLIRRSEKKLNNQDFLRLAPKEIVEKERTKLINFKQQLI